MVISDIIALIVIVAVFLVATTYFIIKSNGKKNHVRNILKSYPTLVLALLNRDKIPTVSELSEELLDKILSLSDDDWQEWNALSKNVMKISNKYPYTLYEYINDLFPEYKERIVYKKKIALFTPIPQRVNFALSSLLLDELRKIDGDSEFVWKQRDELRLYANKIREKYPEGYKTYCTIHKSGKPLYSEIVNDKKQIAELQKIFNESKGYDGWEKKQEEFSSKYWQILKDVRSQDGRYTYEIPFKKTTRKGVLVDSKFKIWQGFCESFSSFLLDKQAKNFHKKFEGLSSLENRKVYFVEKVYEDIVDVIKKIKKEIDGEIMVVFVDKCKRNWSQLTYEYHYRHIREILDVAKIPTYNLSEIPYINDNGNINGLFVFDLITSNDELKYNSKLLIEHFNISVPLIGYYSLEKEYDEEELLKIAESHEGFLLPKEYDENEYLELLKASILQSKKAERISYLAIPNTWIGSAVGAEKTKKTWLKNPDALKFRTKRENGILSGEYSIDGGANYVEIVIEGDTYNVEDMARFTYKLFKKMGVLSQFKENGNKAIEYMNAKGFLIR